MDRIKELQRKKNRLYRHIYYALKKPDEPDINEDFNLKIQNAEEYDIVSLVQSRKEVKRSAPNRFMSKCPLHEDKFPSLVMYVSTNSFHCFSCKIGGSPIDFIMKVDSTTFIEAIKQLN